MMNETILITGGTSGIGREIALLCLSRFEDARIFITYGHNDARARSFLEELNGEQRERVSLIKADMSSYESMMEMVSEIKGKTECLDYLVSNVGITSYARFDDYTFEEWNKVLNTNLSVPIFMIKEVKAIMPKGGGGAYC